MQPYDEGDFDKISRLVDEHMSKILELQELDTVSEAYSDEDELGMDIKAAAAAAVVRALTVHSENPNVVNILAAVWLEGFVIGIKFAEDKTE